MGSQVLSITHRGIMAGFDRTLYLEFLKGGGGRGMGWEAALGKDDCYAIE